MKCIVYILIFTCYFTYQLVHCAFISRLKNPYLYNTPYKKVVMLPEDYLVDELNPITTNASTDNQIVDKRAFTQKVLWDDKAKDHLWAPYKIQFRQTKSTKYTETASVHTNLGSWPTFSWAFLRSKSTTELLTMSPTSSLVPAPKRTWRPYYPEKNKYIFNNNIFTRKVINLKANVTITTPAIKSTYEMDSQLINLPATRIRNSQRPDTLLRVIFHDDRSKHERTISDIITSKTNPMSKTTKRLTRPMTKRRGKIRKKKPYRVRPMTRTRIKFGTKPLRIRTKPLRNKTKSIRISTSAMKKLKPKPKAIAYGVVLDHLAMNGTNLMTFGQKSENVQSLAADETVFCYECGLYTQGLSNTECYEAFYSEDQRKRYELAQRQRKCSKPYLGGCFLRHLDFTFYYSERGCRVWPPVKGKSFASKRLRRLEYVLHGVKDGCTKSPAASLTPFSKAVSLYSYYYVCVCSKKFCNSANSKYLSQELFGISYVFVCLYNQYIQS